MKKQLITLTLGLLFSASLFAAEMTVEQVNQQMQQLKGKQVTVTGKVVKVNNGIMRRNFLHIQDGTGGQGTNDLTVTSNQTASVGNNVTVTGTVVLGTDFGMGYMYPLLVEKASITVNK
ncbi:MAG TPA: hypothetical protein ENI97_06850 [Gammaproteobacteria bacterium]|nr:hypothetical protein [Gammaproteobacteria bacterium]